MKNKRIYALLLMLLPTGFCMAQQTTDTSQISQPRKNVIRYNLSGALFFGFDKYIVLGYERVIAPNRSISINAGSAALPKLITISTDSFQMNKDQERKGFNFSVDYRFYLAKENKFQGPRGVYIGPYYSYNHFTSETRWDYKNSGGASFVNSNTSFNIHTVGFEVGYQFILWDRLALDFVMVGPGFGFYNYEAKFDGNVTAATKEQLFEGLEQLVSQKFPGMNYVFSDEEIDANGVMRTNTLGYRYIIHIGYNF
jgi:hypothetical protein